MSIRDQIEIQKQKKAETEAKTLEQQQQDEAQAQEIAQEQAFLAVYQDRESLKNIERELLLSQENGNDVKEELKSKRQVLRDLHKDSQELDVPLLTPREMLKDEGLQGEEEIIQYNETRNKAKNLVAHNKRIEDALEQLQIETKDKTFEEIVTEVKERIQENTNIIVEFLLKKETNLDPSEVMTLAQEALSSIEKELHDIENKQDFIERSRSPYDGTRKSWIGRIEEYKGSSENQRKYLVEDKDKTAEKLALADVFKEELEGYKFHESKPIKDAQQSMEDAQKEVTKLKDELEKTKKKPTKFLLYSEANKKRDVDNAQEKLKEAEKVQEQKIKEYQDLFTAGSDRFKKFEETFRVGVKNKWERGVYEKTKQDLENKLQENESRIIEHDKTVKNTLAYLEEAGPLKVKKEEYLEKKKLLNYLLEQTY